MTASLRNWRRPAFEPHNLLDAEVKVLQAAQLSEKQLDIIRRADRYTDFNDLAVNSSLGREGVAMQLKAVIAADQLPKTARNTGPDRREKNSFRKRKKRIIRHAM